MTDRYAEYVIHWLKDERSYQVGKFGIDADREHTLEFNVGNPEWWNTQINMYLHRAMTLGLHNPNGRQALAKATATCLGFLEAAVREFGELPAPGVSSGHNLDNLLSMKVVIGSGYPRQGRDRENEN